MGNMYVKQTLGSKCDIFMLHCAQTWPPNSAGCLRNNAVLRSAVRLVVDTTGSGLAVSWRLINIMEAHFITCTMTDSAVLRVL